MRIEEVDKIKLSKACDKELLILKLRFTQAWDRNIRNKSPVVVSDLTCSQFLKSYKLLLDEMHSRKLEHSTSAIDKAAFKKVMVISKFGIDVSDFEDIVIVPDYVLVDVPVPSIEKILDFVKVKQSEISDLFDLAGDSDSAYIPLYDLVLKAKQDTVVVEISKPYPNEHSARLQSPDKFDPKSFRRTSGGTLYGSKKISSTIAIIWGKLKGKIIEEEDKPRFEPIRDKLTQEDVDSLYIKAMKHPYLTDWEKVTTTTGLTDLFQGEIPPASTLVLM
ncbi:hypothetical protein LCGC14_1968030, partial [marine sediment metagenome]